MNVGALLDQAKDALHALSSCLCASDSTLKLNGRNFKILRLIGDGGFSEVYLAQDLASSRLFALKKIRCQLGAESVRTALKEVEAYKKFRHPNIIRCLDSVVVQDKEGEGKIIYLFLPYYKNGTVQGIIASNAVNGSKYPERELLSVFLGACEAVRAMHEYTTGPTAVYPPTPSSSTNLEGGIRGEDDEEDEEGPIMTGTEGEALIGGTLSEVAAEAGIEGVGEPSGSSSESQVVPWAHRDIKPANIMLADDGRTPILMDFGSACAARIPIPNRSVALTQQDIAAEQCSMPFRAPELFDVKTGQDLTEAVDIWSLGCTLFAMAYGTSPFETLQQSEHGGSIAMAVLNGKYTLPADGGYSENLRELVRMMLVVKAEDRPKIGAVLEATSRALAKLE